MGDHDRCYICLCEGDDATFLKCDTCESVNVHYECFAENIFRGSASKPIVGYVQKDDLSGTNLFDCGVHRGAISRRLKLRVALDYEGINPDDTCIREVVNHSTPLTSIDVLQLLAMVMRTILCNWVITWFSTWTGTNGVNTYLLISFSLLMTLEYLGLRLFMFARDRLGHSPTDNLRLVLYSLCMSEYRSFVISSHFFMTIACIVTDMVHYLFTYIVVIPIPSVNQALAVANIVRALILSSKYDSIDAHDSRRAHSSSRLIRAAFSLSYLLWSAHYLIIALQYEQNTFIAVGRFQWFALIETQMEPLARMVNLFLIHVESYWKYRTASVIFEDEEQHKRIVVHFSRSEHLISPLFWLTAVDLSRDF